MLKQLVKRNIKRIEALALAGTMLATSIHFDYFGLFKEAQIDTYAFHRQYGVCTDNHNYSNAGSNCNGDVYAPITVPTEDKVYGSDEWRTAIDYNIAQMRSVFGDEDKIARVFWGGIISTVVNGTGAVDEQAYQGAVYWFNYGQDEMADSMQHGYANPAIGAAFAGMTEAEFGKIRHVGRTDPVFTRDPLLYALTDTKTLFPEAGMTWPQIEANLFGNGGKGYAIVCLSKAFLSTYDPATYGEGGVAQWPVDSQSSKTKDN